MWKSKHLYSALWPTTAMEANAYWSLVSILGQSRPILAALVLKCSSTISFGIEIESDVEEGENAGMTRVVGMTHVVAARVDVAAQAGVAAQLLSVAAQVGAAVQVDVAKMIAKIVDAARQVGGKDHVPARGHVADEVKCVKLERRFVHFTNHPSSTLSMPT